jgi:hypothetical protein
MLLKTDLCMTNRRTLVLKIRTLLVLELAPGSNKVLFAIHKLRIKSVEKSEHINRYQQTPEGQVWTENTHLPLCPRFLSDKADVLLLSEI